MTMGKGERGTFCLHGWLARRKAGADASLSTG